MEFPKKISKRNKRGIIVLIFLLAVITILPRAYGWYRGNEPILMSVEELDRGVSELEIQQLSSNYKKYNKKQKRYKTPASKFDPNNYEIKDWMSLGLSEKQANVIVRFAQRGIRSNDQLAQIFVIDDALFELIKDSTYYPSRNDYKQPENFDKQSTKTYSAQKVDLNRASQEELKSLKGIGDFYAAKIIEYREQLGGYVSEEQLLELWKFDQEKLQKLKGNIKIDESAVKQININTCTAEELSKHPYIRWNIANSIVKMRTKFQKYTNFDQLLESELISTELLEKIKPYLRLE